MANRIHPIYTALDSHQYAKAVKLASALSTSNVLGQALLAYAQYKNGQSPQALFTIRALLCWKNSCGSETEETDIVRRVDQESTRIDWIAPENLIPSSECRIDFADEATLETIAITLHGLHRFEMIYQLYAWAGQFHPSIRFFTLRKQYAAGLQLLVRSTSNDSILASMQALALQMARQSSSYTAWAARTALWQWQFSSATTDPTDLRYQMLPRLAESLAKKMMHQSNDKCTIEDCLLIVEIYKSQAKWNDLLEMLPTLSKLTPVQNLDIQATCWRELEQWEQAECVYRLLLEKQPGQWSYWKAWIHCSIQHNGWEHAAVLALECASKLQGERPTRSIALVSCELALSMLSDDDSSCANLLNSMKKYAERFCPQASCVFSDLELYFENFLRVGTSTLFTDLSGWADTMRKESIQHTGGDDRSKLRCLIFALQVLQKLNRAMPQLELPSWTEIAKQWKSFPTTVGAQKENQPSDELILLAVDELLKGPTCTVQEYLAAATLLEMGLQHSPHNPNLKLRLIGVYHSLHATECSWILFCDLGMKHIQVDSCSYIILPILLEGGLYQQALSLANETLKFHISTLTDTSDFVTRALENGIWSKADEFLCFQRNRLNRSVSLLDSKGLIMDCAPLSSAGVGFSHGVVGGIDDVERATRIMEEAHNSTGAPGILTLDKKLEALSDNRDLSILPTGMRATSKADIIQTALRRKLYHNILIRAALVLDITKAPKKGKLTKPSEALLLRCESLRRILDEDEERPTSKWEDAIKLLARVIVIVTVGSAQTDRVGDSLQIREEVATKLLDEAHACIPKPTIEISPSYVGKVIVDHLVTIIAVTKMTAELFLRFGWGKRKKRASVSALAQCASELKTFVIQMIAVAQSLDQEDLTPPQYDVLDEVILLNVCNQVQQSRKDTSIRLIQKLAVFRDELSTFEQAE